MLRPALFLFVVALCCVFPGEVSGQPLAWRHDYNAALDEARERGAPVFILFAGLPCHPAEQMYRRVFTGKEFGDATKDFVCIICHLQDTRESYFLGWPAYLRQYFFTPSYVFASPAGDPLMPDFTIRTQHQMLKPKMLLAVFRQVRARYDQVVPLETWRKVREQLEEAETAFAEKNWPEALKSYCQIEEQNEVPSLATRAAARRKLVTDYLDFGRELAAQSMAGKLAGKTRLTYLEALDLARKGWTVKAREDLAGWPVAAGSADHRRQQVLDRALVDQLRRSIRAGRIKVTRVCPDIPYNAYWQIGVTVCVDLPEVDQLTVQYHVLTATNKVFAGFHTYEDVEETPRLQVAAYLPLDQVATRSKPGAPLQFAGVKDVHFAVYAGKTQVASRTRSGTKEEWWRANNPQPLIFLDNMHWTWEMETTNDVIAKGLVFGEKYDYVPPVMPAPGMKAEIAVEMLNQDIVMPSLRFEVKVLMEIGAPAVPPLLAAFNPGSRAVYTFANILSRLQAKAAIPEIVSLLKSESYRLRAYFLERLASYGDDYTVPTAAIVPLLADKQAKVRRQAARLLGWLRDEASLPALVAHLEKAKDQETYDLLREAIMRITVNDFGFPATIGKGDFATGRERYRQWALNSAGKTRAFLVCLALGKAGYPVTLPAVGPREKGVNMVALLAAAEDQRWWLAYAALRFLADQTDAKTFPVFLAHWWQSKRIDIQLAARRGLYAVADRGSLEELITFGEKNPAMARQVVGLLQELAGNHTFVSDEGYPGILKLWATWLTDNKEYLYRPSGAVRFNLNQAARRVGKPVDPLSGKY